MICFWSFFPTGCNRTFYHRIFFFDIVYQIGIHVIRTCRFRIKAETVMEFSKYVVYDGFLIFHRKHPNAEILGFIFFTEFITRQAKQRQCDLITVFLMVSLCKLYRFIIEQRSVCHLNSSFQSVLVRNGLLCLKNVQGFCQQSFSADIFLFAVSGYLFRILRNHLRTMDDVYNKLIIHSVTLTFRHYINNGQHASRTALMLTIEITLCELSIVINYKI